MKTILDETPGVRLAPLTVDQYEAMIAQGILPEGAPIELLDGLLVLKDRAASGGKPMTVGPEHQLVIKKLMRFEPRFVRLGCHLSIQGPIRIPPRHEPEPDGAVVAGVPEDYAKRHPGPREVSCVIEVADSSLLRDKTAKLRIYAAAGIGQYVIVNLVDRRVEVYEVPSAKEERYRSVDHRTGAQTVVLAAAGGKAVKVKARDLLP